MSAVPNPVFMFNCEVRTVKITNIAESATRQEIVNLFATLIGEVSKCEESTDGNRRVITMTFATHDAAKKALCMSGYNVAGIPLAVTVSSPSEPPRVPKQGAQSDNRRNLYVLGLPFDLNKTEFVGIFSRYGTVSHAVILATVDNASRRRGFVVMSNYSEARAAMDGLNRKEIKGHTIDVSWAVVQRSQGFLDGGDRTTALSSQSPCPSPSPFEFGGAQSAPSSGHVSLSSTPLQERAPSCMAPVQAASLLVNNLPAVLFSQISDLHPLFCPYGEIKKIDILDSNRSDANQGDITVVVEYATIPQAMDARDALHGQKYSNNPVTVEFIQQPVDNGGGIGSASCQLVRSGINPHATPFFVTTGLPPNTVFAPMAPLYAESNQNRLSAAVPSGLLAVNPCSLSPYATPASMYTHLYVPVTGAMRPNSAPSPWSDSAQPVESANWAFSQLQHFPNLSTPSLRQTYTA